MTLILLFLLILCSAEDNVTKSSLPVCSLTNGQNAIYWWISEGKEPGSQISILPIEGISHGPGADIGLELVNGQDFFILNSAQKSLSLKKRVDRDDGMARILGTVECTSLVPGENFQVNISVQVMLLDENDNKPNFAQSAYSVNVTEELPVGSVLLSGFEATDADQDGPNSQVQYFVAQGQPFHDLVAIPNPWEAVVTIAKRIDFEKIPHFNFTIRAADGGTPEQESQALVTVQVIDADDMNPEFDEKEYFATITPNTQIGTSVAVFPTSLHAKDADTLNAPLTYSLTGDNRAKFKLDAATAELALVDNLEPGDIFYLTVIAQQTDRPERLAQVPLKIAVQGRVHSPGKRLLQKLQYTASVLENTPVGTRIVTLLPDDMKSILQYTLVEGQNVPFAVDSQRGFITLASPLDYEMTKKHRFSVKVSDGHTIEEADIRIAVIDINDHPPIFLLASYAFRLGEDVKNGDIVGVVKAQDADENDRVRYHLLSFDRQFAVDPATGSIRVKEVEFLDQSRYELIVEASDQRDSKRASTVKAVIDVSVPPGSEAKNSEVLKSQDFQPPAEQERAGSSAMLVIIAMGTAIGLLVIVIGLLLTYIVRRRKASDQFDGTPPKIVLASSDESISRTLPTTHGTTIIHNKEPLAITQRYSTGSELKPEEILYKEFYHFPDDSPHGSQSPLGCDYQREKSGSVAYANAALEPDRVANIRPIRHSTYSTYGDVAENEAIRRSFDVGGLNAQLNKVQVEGLQKITIIDSGNNGDDAVEVMALKNEKTSVTYP